MGDAAYDHSVRAALNLIADQITVVTNQFQHAQAKGMSAAILNCFQTTLEKLVALRLQLIQNVASSSPALPQQPQAVAAGQAVAGAAKLPTTNRQAPALPMHPPAGPLKAVFGAKAAQVPRAGEKTAPKPASMQARPPKPQKPCVFSKCPAHFGDLFVNVKDLCFSSKMCDTQPLPNYEDEDALWFAYYHLLLAEEHCIKYLESTGENAMHFRLAQVFMTLFEMRPGALIEKPCLDLLAVEAAGPAANASVIRPSTSRFRMLPSDDPRVVPEGHLNLKTLFHGFWQLTVELTDDQNKKYLSGSYEMAIDDSTEKSLYTKIDQGQKELMAIAYVNARVYKVFKPVSVIVGHNGYFYGLTYSGIDPDKYKEGMSFEDFTGTIRMTERCSPHCIKRPLDYIRLLLSLMYPGTQQFNRAKLEEALQRAENESRHKASRHLQSLQVAHKIMNAPVNEEFAQRYWKKMKTSD